MKNIIWVLLLTLSSVVAHAADTGEVGQYKKVKTFLLVNHLPAFTGIIKRNLNNKEVALTNEQKKELKQIRSRTLRKMKKVVKPAIKLQRSIREQIMFGVDPESLSDEMDKLAALKKQASINQMICIQEHLEVLTDRQIKLLLD